MSSIDQKKDFLIEVSKGQRPGHTLLYKFGHGTVGTTPTQIWAGGSTPYIYLTAAATLYLSSTDSGDTSAPILVIGLDTNGDYQFETVNLDDSDAQTQVPTLSPYVRALRAQHMPTGGGWGGSAKLAGTLYIAGASGSSGGVPSVADDILVVIPPGNEQTQLGFLTIPNGFTGMIQNITMSTESAKTISTDLQIREFGGTFATKGKSASLDNPIPRRLYVYDQIPSKSDIQMLVNVSASTGLVSIQMDILLVDNDLVAPLSFDASDVV